MTRLAALTLVVVASVQPCAAQTVIPYQLATNGHSFKPRASADGSRIVFISDASNLDLVTPVSPGVKRVYVWFKSPPSGFTLLASRSADGAPANADCEDVTISPSGRYVAFSCHANNLVPGDTNGWLDIFSVDVDTLLSGKANIVRSNVPQGGGQSNLPCGHPSLSNWNAIAYECYASNMVPGDTNNVQDVFVSELDGDGIERISTTSSGLQAEGGYSGYPSIDAEARRVAFDSAATNLHPGDTRVHSDVFLKDLGSKQLVLVSRVSGTSLPAGELSRFPAISGDGRWITYQSDARNLDPQDIFFPDVSATSDIFLYDVTYHSNRRVTSNRQYSALRPSISHAGDFVAFYTAASHAANDIDINTDVYVYRRDANNLVLVSQSTDGQTGSRSDSMDPTIAPSPADGGSVLVVWSSYASNLVHADRNGKSDIFARRMERFVDVISPTAVAGGPQYVGSRVRVVGRRSGKPALSESASFGRAGSEGAPSPAIAVGGLPARGVVLVDDDTLDFGMPPLPAGGSHLAIVTYADGDVLTLPVFIRTMAIQPGSPTDTDADGVPDWWELTYGTDPTVADATADADGDGMTTGEEFTLGHHPLMAQTQYFAEGATGGGMFLTRIALANPGVLPAHALLRYLRGDATVRTQSVVVPATGRATVDVESVADMANAEFATAIETDQPLLADRTMRWTTAGRYGSHAERSVPSPALTWYLAEGATHSGFDLFYLLQNPGSTAADVEVTYLLPTGGPIVKTYTVEASSRFNIWVDAQGPTLESTDVSAIVRVTNGVPIIVERAMYLSRPDQIFVAGHESAAIRAPATEWFLAEGATGPYFDLFVLVANPNAQAAAVTADFLLGDGTVVSKTYTVAGNSRFNIWVDLEDPRLADAGVSTLLRVTNGVPVIVERAMWWPGDFTTWQEAHNSPGSTSTGTRWGLAEGEVGGPDNTDTYLLIANTSPHAGQAVVTLLFEDGTTTSRTVTLLPNSRFNLPVGAPEPFGFGPVVANKRFGAVVDSVATGGHPPAQLAVERAMYASPGGAGWCPNGWCAGTNALATKLP